MMSEWWGEKFVTGNISVQAVGPDRFWITIAGKKFSLSQAELFDLASAVDDSLADALYNRPGQGRLDEGRKVVWTDQTPTNSQ